MSLQHILAAEEVCIPLLEENSKLKINQDFYCGFSPERIIQEIKNMF